MAETVHLQTERLARRVGDRGEARTGAVAPPGRVGQIAPDAQRKLRDDLLDRRHLRVETVEEDVLDLDEGSAGIDREPHEEVEMAAPIRAGVLPLPAHQQPEWSRLLDLETRRSVVASRETRSVLAPDPEVEPSLADELPFSPDAQQRNAVFPVDLQLQHAVVDDKQVPALDAVDPLAGQRSRSLLAQDQRVSALLQRREVGLVVDEQPADAPLIVSLQYAGLNRTQVPLLVTDRDRSIRRQRSRREWDADRQGKGGAFDTARLGGGQRNRIRPGCAGRVKTDTQRDGREGRAHPTHT